LSLITLQEISLQFGGDPVLDRVNLQIEDNERICLVGRNGEGKSTLLNVISGILSHDSGRIIRQPGLKVAMLEQEIPTSLSGTVHDVVSRGLENVAELTAKHHEISDAMADTNDPALLSHLEEIEQALEAAGGWQSQNQIDTILKRLDLEPNHIFSDLSGGMKRRVLLAKALVCEPDLILLDEPTNHLDLNSINWLEEFLLSAKCSLLFITHDRLLANTLATRIIDLDRGKLTSWPGDYHKYVTSKEEALAVEAEHRKKFDKKLSQEETWIRQGIKARRTRNQGRVRALLSLREERKARRETTGKAKIKMQEAESSGKIRIQAKNISYQYDNQEIVSAFSTTILRGDKVGIIGPNGCGKTTLLKLLLGELTVQSGKIKHGTNLQIAYFDQLRAQLDEEKSISENVAEGNDTVLINGRPQHIIGYLKDFLFTPEQARTPVKSLSGGERNRLLLAKLFTKPANILVLDEPTNDLDVATLELLEELLLDYQGTVLLVSHDRTFINNVVTSTLVFEKDGSIIEYAGGYDDWLVQKKNQDTVQQPPKKIKKGKPKSQNTTPRKLSFKEKKELAELPPNIEAMEKEQQELYDLMADPTFYQENAHQAADMKTRLESLSQNLEEAYHRWEELDSIPEN